MTDKETNDWLAIHVMGWERCEPGCNIWHRSSADEAGMFYVSDPIPYFQLWEPTNSLEQAMQVVDALGLKGKAALLFTYHPDGMKACRIFNSVAAPFSVDEVFFHPSYYEDGVSCRAKTLSEAICRAAVLAI